MKNRVNMNPCVGIISFQGGVEEHYQAFKQLTPEVQKIKYPEDLKNITHLVIPGGESTVIGRFLESSGLKAAIIAAYNQGKFALWGTCAGAILLGNGDSAYALNLASITTKRNGYGTQVDSFHKRLFSPVLQKDFEAVFIRAPIITAVAPSVEVLSKDGDRPVLCKEKNMLISTFHPELTNDLAIHDYFLNNFH